MDDLDAVKSALYELTTNMEHQSTLWYATPFGMVFLTRILMEAFEKEDANCVAHFLADDLFYSFYYYSWQAVLAYKDKLEQCQLVEYAPKIAKVLAEL